MAMLTLLAALQGAFLHPAALPIFVSSSPRVAVRCCDVDSTLPESAMESIPPGQLADAWQRDEKVCEL